jgi:hypothetical protein
LQSDTEASGVSRQRRKTHANRRKHVTFFVVLGTAQDASAYGYALAAAPSTIAAIDCLGMLLAIGLNRVHARHAARNRQPATNLAVYREAP